jgi:phosphodiesterase/alkaline phosphatase D-like protein
VSFPLFISPALSCHLVRSGEEFASQDVDFTVKEEVTELEPDAKYWYFLY